MPACPQRLVIPYPGGVKSNTFVTLEYALAATETGWAKTSPTMTNAIARLLMVGSYVFELQRGPRVMPRLSESDPSTERMDDPRGPVDQGKPSGDILVTTSVDPDVDAEIVIANTWLNDP
jgi:hypothetical protein